MRPALAYVLLFVALIAAFPGFVFGQSNDDRRVNREREMLRRLQDQTRKAEQDKATLAAEADELKKKLKDAEQSATRNVKKSRDVEKALAQAEQQNATLNVEKVNLTERLDQLTRSLAEIRDELAKTDQKVREGGAALDRAALAQQVQKAELDRAQSVIGQRDREVRVCEAKNLKLYEYNVQLLGRYQGKGFLDVLRQKEPITGMKNVEIENLLEEYRDKIDAQQIASDRSSTEKNKDRK